MKKLLTAFCVLLMLSCNEKVKSHKEANAEKPADAIVNVIDDTVSDAESKTNSIAEIKDVVSHINTSGNLTKKHYEFMCDATMKVDYFYEDGVIVKIAVDFGTVGDVYAKEGYYYKDGKLVFIYEFTEGGPACEGCIKKHEYRSYIKDNSVIKYMKDKDVAICRECGFNASTPQYKLLGAKSESEIKSILCPGIN